MNDTASAPHHSTPEPATASFTAAPTQQAALTPAQAQQMSEWIKADVAAGKLTPEKAAAAFQELGTPLDQRGPDQRTDEEKQFDQAFPTAKPEEYLIRYGLPDGQPLSPEMKQFDSTARGWLSDAGFARSNGNSLINAITKTVQQTQRMTEAELDTFSAAEYAKLERVYGAHLEEKLQAAAKMIDDLDRRRPGLRHLLRAKGIGDAAEVVNAILLHAPIYAARKGR